ncbi:MAG: ribulose-phosphate 3-epimerase [Elusimicrobia bacterium]|nr:ribulose-phosphate 3-epimerase [Candidatus Obscuribacterium magneticum]
MNPLIIAPSILSADFGHLCDAAQLMEKAGADWLHVDVMDGHFVPNITIGPVVVKWLKKCTKLPLDVHVMISDPMKFAKPFAEAGAWALTFHYEAVTYPEVVINEIKRLGLKAGISIKPKTPAKLILPFLKDLYFILVMTVEPGFGGQSFLRGVLPKIKEISEYIKDNNLKCRIAVDGGINSETGFETVKAGAQILVAGHSIFDSPDPIKAVQDLKSITA